MKPVFYGAGAFLLISLALFILAMSLIPTDLGNSYLIGACVFAVGAGLLAGMGRVGATIIREIGARIAPPAVAPLDDAPVVRLPQIPISAPDPPKSAPAAVVAAPVLAGVAAGALVAGQRQSRPKDAPQESEMAIAPNERLLDALERDLFADPLVAPTLPVSEPPLEIRPNPGVAPLAAEAVGADGTAGPAPESPIGQVEADIGENAADAPDAGLDETPVPIFRPEPQAEAPAAQAGPTPGLIADDDLAALHDSGPPLAPLETLEVVGAYDSGGTRFTMYSDGSVTAQGEGVDRRFRSLDDLRTFIDGGMKT